MFQVYMFYSLLQPLLILKSRHGRGGIYITYTLHVIKRECFVMRIQDTRFALSTPPPPLTSLHLQIHVCSEHVFCSRKKSSSGFQVIFQTLPSIMHILRGINSVLGELFKGIFHATLR